MAFPAGWPPRPSSGLRSIRFYATGTATAVFSDNGFLFASGLGANTFQPTPYVPPGGERTQAELGRTDTQAGSPMGAGRANQDSNPDPKLNIPPPPVAMIWSCGIRVYCAADCDISFDGTNIHGKVLAGTTATFFQRYEAGISIKGSGVFHIEAW